MAGPVLNVVGTDGNDSINLVFQSAGVFGDPTDGHDAINTFGGTDIVEAGGGDDQVFLGTGDDFFTWRNGDGDDLVFGDDGHDTFFWRTKSSVLGVEANDDDGVSLTDFNESPELFDIEHLVIFASGNGAVITLGDLSRTKINQVAIDLAGSSDETSGNGDVDTLLLRGSDGGDHITISRSGSQIVVDGLPEQVTVDHAEGAKDALFVSARIRRMTR